VPVACRDLTVLAQLSDPHVEVGPGDSVSSRALAAAVAAVLRLDPAPDAVLLSGDITNNADAASYERVRELLVPLTMPVHVLPGNHDSREALRTWFTEDPVAGAHGAPFQYALRCGALRLVVCDTTQPGREDGRLDAGALAWLEARLAEEPSAPTIVAMHHPPLLTGIGGLDAIGLPEADRDALGAVLSQCGQVRRVVAGHVHRGAFGVLGGCGVFACPSVYQQARLVLRPDAEIALAPGDPAFGVHALLAGGEVVSHVVPV
jgi:3',5'-cyclic-AMP phosphodiesterase